MLYLKNKKKYAKFLIISGVGSLWLTLVYSQVTDLGLSITPPEYIDDFFPAILYFAINSFLLLISGILLYSNKIKAHTIATLMLMLFVTASIFVNAGDINLFIGTVSFGMIPGIVVGGTILVPMFLISTYLTSYRIFKSSIQKKQKTVS